MRRANLLRTWRIVSAMQAELEHWIGQKMFILVSTVLTWAKSKPLDPVSLFLFYLKIRNIMSKYIIGLSEKWY